jgi:hypothetical protein
VQRQLKQDGVNPNKLVVLEKSDDPAVTVIAKLLRGRSEDAARDLRTRIDTVAVQLGDVDDAAAHARALIAAAVVGEDLTVSDLQLISALTSSEAATGTRDLRSSGRIDAARTAVERVTGIEPVAPVLVMAQEMQSIGFGGQERGSYMTDAEVITVQPDVSDHTLRHELVHATQPVPPESGPALCRREMIEGTTDALALAAGSTEDEISYAAQVAAVLAFAAVLERPRGVWLRDLNDAATPEVTVGDAIGTDGDEACRLFSDVQFAASNFAPDIEGRVEAAADALRARRGRST